MINIIEAKKKILDYLNQYEDRSNLGFNLKLVHTMKVVNSAKIICDGLNLSKEDANLAELIALLHDLGRFEELRLFKRFESVKYDHALFATKVLFDEGLIRNFIEDNSYDNIIRKAIENHNKLNIEDGLTQRELLHAKIVRDADKLDNFRVRVEDSIESIFKSRFESIDEFNDSLISDNVYKSILNNECVKLKDRVYPIDYWLCVLAFVFDLNFKETFKILKENDYINALIDRFNYTNEDTIEKMNNIRKLLNDYVDEQLRK